jgi:sulfur-carrier protein
MGLFARWREAYGLIAVRLVYFAKVREAIGLDSEEREVAAGFTVGAVLDELAASGDHYADAFANRAKLRFALNQQMVSADTVIGEAKELAIFPPVTGG